MSYEALTKKKQYLNKEALIKPIYFSNQKKILRAYMDNLLCCLTLGFFQFEEQEEIDEKNG